MGGAQSSSAAGSNKPTPLGESIRAALRVSDGPFAADAAGINHTTNTTTSPPSADNGTVKQQQQQDRRHRSALVLQLLENATRRDITTEHMLELVDGHWDESHDGVPKVIGRLCRLGSDDQVHVLAVTCLLYQRCWLALDFALQELLARRRSSEQRKKNGAIDAQTTDAVKSVSDAVETEEEPLQLERLFAQACYAAPIPCIERVMELGWIDKRGLAAAEQFRILMMRICMQHRPPLSPEERTRRKLLAEKNKNQKRGVASSSAFSPDRADDTEEEKKHLAQKKKLGGVVVAAAAAAEGEASETATAASRKTQRLLISFLRMLGDQPVDTKTALDALEQLPVPAADDPSEEARLQRSAVPSEYCSDVDACDLIREALLSYVRPWRQIEATVNETPLSWIVAPDRTRKYVCVVAMALQMRGLTFPGWCKVLSFLATPNME